MKQYQYKIIPIREKYYFDEKMDVEKLEQQLNDYGKQGWELVEFLGNQQYALFKKENNVV